LTVAAQATAAANAASVVAGASNADDLTLAVTYTLADTLANLTAADAAVRSAADSYSLTETAFTAAAVSSDVAGLTAAQDDAVVAVQAVLDADEVLAGAANAADVTVVNGAYTLADTLANLSSADADLLSDAASYSLTDVAQRFNSVTEAQAAVITGASNAASYTFGLQGVTRTFTTATDDELEGTANDDVFSASSNLISATDAVDGNGGTDILNITLVGNLAAAEIDDIEIINIVIEAIAEPTLNFTNVGGAPEVVISRTLAGMSDSIVVTAGGDFTYTVGEGIDELELDGYDEGVINTGTVLTTLTIDAAAELNLNLDGTQEIDLAGTGAIADATITAKAATGAVDVTGAADFTGDLNLVGAVTITGDSDIFDAGTITGADATLVFDASTAGAISMEDITVSGVEIDTAVAIAITEAQGNTFTITEDGSDVTADTGTDGGTFEIVVAAGTSTIVVNAANADSSTVTFTADAEDSTLLTIGTTTNVVTQGDTEFTSIDEDAVTNEMNLRGTGDLDITSLAVTSLNASSFTGAITAETVLATNSSLTLGTGDDEITVDALAVGETNVIGNAGNDTVNAEAMSGTAGDLVFRGGAGDDTLVLGGNTGSTGTYIFIGGDGHDTVTIDASAALVDLTTLAGLALDSVEAIEIEGANGIDVLASQFDGLTTVVSGTALAGEVITITSATTDSAIDLSGITFANTVDTINVNLTLLSNGANSFVGSDSAEVVTGTEDGTSFNFNLGGGDDSITLDAAGIPGTLTLGAGSDTVILVDGSSLLAAASLVRISDFNNEEDTIDTALANTAISADILAAAAVDVSAATTATDNILALVEDGMVVLTGDGANVDTLAEWDAVLDAITVAVGGAGEIYGFEFDGNTYIVETDGTTVVTGIELTGISGLTLTAGGSADAITIA
jgi:hypothetical protein